MSRKDLPLFVALIALLFAWPHIDRHLIRPLFPEKPDRTASAPAERPDRTEEIPDRLLRTEDSRLPLADRAEIPPTVPGLMEADARAEEATPEQLVRLHNDDVEFTFTSRGAAVVSVRLLDYQRNMDPDSDPVLLDFSEAPALAYERLPGLGEGHAFEVESDSRRAIFRRRTPDGLELVRVYTLGEAGYLLQVEDTFANRADEPADVPPHWMISGPMRSLPGETAMRGVAFLGVDTLVPGEKVQNWGRRLPKLFRTDAYAAEPDGPALLLDAPLTGRAGTEAMDWAAAKNKYFVQILRPEFGAESARLIARRETDGKNVPASEVAVALRFGGMRLEPGQADTVRVLHYYAGPKKLANLTDLGYHQVDVMEFGMWSPVGRVLLRILNFFHRLIPNYGIAIILLTVLIRIVFWPVTHKSTQSMRRMQEVQPLVQAMREKYKDNPQRQQRELMALYKEHKVNPLGGCLPMVIQIPVFIALFVVLRSAIELRFAPFLWVRDLSEPENLLAGQLPFGLSLNILPLVMTAVQYWQQKLNPSGGDPSQQKMMGMMPFIMLIFFYQFAAGLVLYWTTNQLLMVAQQLLHRQRKKSA